MMESSWWQTAVGNNVLLPNEWRAQQAGARWPFRPSRRSVAAEVRPDSFTYTNSYHSPAHSQLRAGEQAVPKPEQQ